MSRYNRTRSPDHAVMLRIASTARENRQKWSIQKPHDILSGSTLSGVRIRLHCFILTVDQYPQPDLTIRVAKVLRNSRLRCPVYLLLGHAECREVRERSVFPVGDGKTKTFMVRKGFIGDSFGNQERVLLLSLLRFHLDTLHHQSSF